MWESEGEAINAGTWVPAMRDGRFHWHSSDQSFVHPYLPTCRDAIHRNCSCLLARPHLIWMAASTSRQYSTVLMEESQLLPYDITYCLGPYARGGHASTAGRLLIDAMYITYYRIIVLLMRAEGGSMYDTYRLLCA